MTRKDYFVKIKQVIDSPVTQFFVGCLMLFNGLMLWFTDTLAVLDGFIRLFVTGVFLLTGFIEVGSNYQYIVYSSYRNKVKKEKIELDLERKKFQENFDEYEKTKNENS